MAKYCSNCGSEVDENAYVCVKCGVVVNNNKNNVSNDVDNGGFLWSVLGFFVPVAGLILYLVWKKEKPKTAKNAGIGALISVILNVVLIIFAFVLVFSIEDEFNDNYYEYDDYYYNFE